jgi:hypothetical protein
MVVVFAAYFVKERPVSSLVRAEVDPTSVQAVG